MSAVWAARGGFWKEKGRLDQQAEARTPGQHAQALFRTGTPATQVGGVSPPTLAGSTGIVSSMCWALLTSWGPAVRASWERSHQAQEGGLILPMSQMGTLRLRALSRGTRTRIS